LESEALRCETLDDVGAFPLGEGQRRLERQALRSFPRRRVRRDRVGVEQVPRHVQSAQVDVRSEAGGQQGPRHPELRFARHRVGAITRLERLSKASRRAMRCGRVDQHTERAHRRLTSGRKGERLRERLARPLAVPESAEEQAIVCEHRAQGGRIGGSNGGASRA
jgi:hypothetical protein